MLIIAKCLEIKEVLELENKTRHKILCTFVVANYIYMCKIIDNA